MHLQTVSSADFIGHVVRPVVGDGGVEFEEGIDLLRITPLKGPYSNPDRVKGRFKKYQEPVNIFKQRKLVGWFPMKGPSTQRQEVDEMTGKSKLCTPSLCYA